MFHFTVFINFQILLELSNKVKAKGSKQKAVVGRKHPILMHQMAKRIFVPVMGRPQDDVNIKIQNVHRCCLTWRGSNLDAIASHSKISGQALPFELLRIREQPIEQTMMLAVILHYTKIVRIFYDDWSC